MPKKDDDTAAFRVPFADTEGTERLLRKQEEQRRREQRRHTTDAKHEVLRRKDADIPK